LGTDVANKTYVDAVSQGFGLNKEACRVATTASFSGIATFQSASKPATFTEDLTTGTLTIDGISVAIGDRVLVKDETLLNAPQNGIYERIANTGGGSWVLQRASDFDNSPEVGEIRQGATVYIIEGTDNGSDSYIVTSATVSTIDDDDITFVLYSNSGNTTDPSFNSVTITGSDALTYGGNTLSTAEFEQLCNIEGNTISDTEWGYVANMQDVATTATPSFASLTSTGDIATTSGNITITAGNLTIGGNALTSAQVGHLENLDQTITTDQWGYLGASDQGIATTNDVTFNKVTSGEKVITTGATAGGEVTTKVLSATSTGGASATLSDDGTTDYVFSMADGDVVHGSISVMVVAAGATDSTADMGVREHKFMAVKAGGTVSLRTWSQVESTRSDGNFTVTVNTASNAGIGFSCVDDEAVPNKKFIGFLNISKGTIPA
jgi:hypothetical protein